MNVQINDRIKNSHPSTYQRKNSPATSLRMKNKTTHYPCNIRTYRPP